MPNEFEAAYLQLVASVAQHGDSRPSRVGRVHSAFGSGLIIQDLQDGYFPVLTTRQIFYKPVFGELAAFLRGATRVAEFQKFGCNYWNKNAAAWDANRGEEPKDHSVGRVYGAQWRKWGDELDQIRNLVDGIKADPYSRRHIVTAWRPDELDIMCLPPCHIMFQCCVTSGSKLAMIVYMRSVDLCLGLPADIVLYAALLLLICKETGYKPGDLTFMLGDLHVYENHFETLKLQLSRPYQPLPKYALDVEATLDNFEPKHLELLEYTHATSLIYPLNV